MNSSVNRSICFEDNGGPYSVFATGPKVPTILTIGSTCNNGNVDLTKEYLKSRGYTVIVIVERN